MVVAIRSLAFAFAVWVVSHVSRSHSPFLGLWCRRHAVGWSVRDGDLRPRAGSHVHPTCIFLVQRSVGPTLRVSPASRLRGETARANRGADRLSQISRENRVSTALIRGARCGTVMSLTLVLISRPRMVAAIRDAFSFPRFVSWLTHKRRFSGGPRGEPVPSGPSSGSARGPK
jgi:hypothetical protein